MSPADLLRSLGGVFAHRLRAALTLLGIVIGTGSIVLLASLIKGGESYLTETSQDITSHDVVQTSKKKTPSDQIGRTSRPLSRGDADAIGETGSGTSLVASESSREIEVDFRGKKKWTTLVSASAATFSLYRLRIESGRALDESDRSAGRRTCLVGHTLYEELLEKTPVSAPLNITFDGQLFSVVGVLANKPATDGSKWGWNQKVLIPETTYDTIYSPSHEVEKIYARKDSGQAAANAIRSKVTGIVLERHFGVKNFALAKDESGGMESLIFNVIQALLLSTGILALVASGINIMNVMLVTVSERRREIGLRRAIGATPRSILVQFLLEAGALSLIGAVIGVAGGALLAWLVATAARSAIGNWAFVLPGWSFVLGIGLAVTMGLAFGILPAWRASRVSPIEALRSE